MRTEFWQHPPQQLGIAPGEVHVWRDFDVTATVQGWVNGTVTNNGFVVRSPTNGVKPIFYSSGYTTDIALRPKLTVVY